MTMASQGTFLPGNKARQPQNLQDRLQAIIGGQVMQIVALQAQLEEAQAELEKLRKQSNGSQPPGGNND